MSSDPHTTPCRRDLDAMRRQVEAVFSGKLISYGAGQLVWQTEDGWILIVQQQAVNND